ncbi:MAG: cell division protein ZapB [Desulfuromonadales bacterium]|nr:cell division protein ZapB [Desulfuromonadales bacterium]
MELSLVLRLEHKIDQLLERNRELEAETLRLRASEEALLAERERFCLELDRILAKLDRLEQEQA